MSFAAPLGGAAKNKNAADSVPDYKNFQKEEENASGGKRFLKPHRPEAPSSEISITHKCSYVRECGKAGETFSFEGGRNIERAFGI